MHINFLEKYTPLPYYNGALNESQLALTKFKKKSEVNFILLFVVCKAHVYYVHILPYSQSTLATGESGVTPSQSSCFATGILRINQIAVSKQRHLFAHAC